MQAGNNRVNTQERRQLSDWGEQPLHFEGLRVDEG
ncbi:hypothetical protein YPC_4644 [Yersinia pestis biovar Medievalis str. Harbin 35]|nr:hypothetical protein YPC_4644 [Yersinia pestis biovar Medievalis str. Harbin 35]EEO74902.1 hypothetical protein YP516_4512 [Yersinia pestis Nepal516]EEO83305.1 hypothetical protein YPF_0238 [Yersinia pestis biovar Orientalis str. India 195]EEO86241.1 hypothetical protein YPH_2150 [Yersinia pestis biovar Orientalis str. PEXU2]EEO88264.1 hypothetical protein YPS_4625 [Yersinia pestis Pestoides A]